MMSEVPCQQHSIHMNANLTSSSKVPGQPSVVAPHYPLNKQAKWYEGADLHCTSQLVGRADKLEEIINSLRLQDIHRPRVIALTGIGGIG